MTNPPKPKNPTPKKTPVKYGEGQNASFKPDADETDPQEYKVGHLPEMEKYTVDKNRK